MTTAGRRANEVTPEQAARLALVAPFPALLGAFYLVQTNGSPSTAAVVAFGIAMSAALVALGMALRPLVLRK